VPRVMVFEVVPPVALVPRVVQTVNRKLVAASDVVAGRVLYHLEMLAQAEQMVQCFPGKAQS
jgi:hypothetical protein